MTDPSVQSYRAEPFEAEDEADWNEPLNEADCMERLALLAAEMADLDQQRKDRNDDLASRQITQGEYDRWSRRWKLARRYKAREHGALSAWLKVRRAVATADPGIIAARIDVEAKRAEAKLAEARAKLAKEEQIGAVKRAEVEAKARLWESLAKAADAKADPGTAAGKLALSIERQHEEFAQLVWIFEGMTARGLDLGPHARKVYRNAKQGMPPGYYERWLTGDRFARWDESCRRLEVTRG